MSLTTKISCNRCGIEKGFVNHWFAILDTQALVMLDKTMLRDLIVIVPLTDKVPKHAVHLCGAACALKEVSERLSTLAAEVSAPSS